MSIRRALVLLTLLGGCLLLTACGNAKTALISRGEPVTSPLTLPLQNKPPRSSPANLNPSTNLSPDQLNPNTKTTLPQSNNVTSSAPAVTEVPVKQKVTDGIKKIDALLNQIDTNDFSSSAVTNQQLGY